MRRSVFDSMDDTLAFKSVLPIKTMIGFGMVLGALPGLLSPRTTSTSSSSPPSWLTIALVAAPATLGLAMMFHGTLYSILIKVLTGKSSDRLTQQVLPGRKTAIRKDSNP